MEDIQIVEQPKNLDINLYIHQLASIYNMEKLEKEKSIVLHNSQLKTNIAINADIAGYGKTMSMVGLIVRDEMEWDLKTSHVVETIENIGKSHIKKIHSKSYPKIGTTLILAGTSIINQWLCELAHTPLQFAAITTKKAVCVVDPSEYDVLVVSPNMYNRLSRRFENIAWKRFIYDEPTSVKCPSMAPIIAGFIWLVCATPDDIYRCHRLTKKNYISNIVGTRDFEYGVREALTIKNNDDFVRRSFTMPQTYILYHECINTIYRAVNGLVNDRIANMIEAGYIAGAVQALGGKNTDNIIELVKKNKTVELEEVRSKILIWGLRGDEEKKKEWEKREKSLLIQLSELEKRFEKMLSSHCTICYESIKQPIMEPSCQNIFCGNCLFAWLKEHDSCPLCRKHINTNELTYIKTKDEKKMEEKILTKEQVILKIIKEKEHNGRVILFSDWNETFDLIRQILSTNNIPFVEIRGTTETKTKKLENFKSGEVRVLFMNSKIDSTGINLQETTDIILYHKMSEATKNQIIGRANRIGRTQPLYVHHLVSN